MTLHESLFFFLNLKTLLGKSARVAAAGSAAISTKVTADSVSVPDVASEARQEARSEAVAKSTVTREAFTTLGVGLAVLGDMADAGPELGIHKAGTPGGEAASCEVVEAAEQTVFPLALSFRVPGHPCVQRHGLNGCRLGILFAGHDGGSARETRMQQGTRKEGRSTRWSPLYSQGVKEARMYLLVGFRVRCPGSLGSN